MLDNKEGKWIIFIFKQSTFKQLTLGPTIMGRFAMLPSKVKYLHLTLQQAFQTGPPPGPALLLPSGGQDDIPETVFFICLSINSATQSKRSVSFFSEARIFRSYRILLNKFSNCRANFKAVCHFPQLSTSGFLNTGRQILSLHFLRHYRSKGCRI